MVLEAKSARFMKMFKCSKHPKTWQSGWIRFLSLVFAASVLTCMPSLSAAVVVSAAAETEIAAPPHYSPGIGEILKMVDAKVDKEVIKAYVKNSLVSYNPTAAEIIALQERGVSSDIIVALLQRGGELKTSAGQNAVQAPPTGAPYAAAPAYQYGAELRL